MGQVFGLGTQGLVGAISGFSVKSAIYQNPNLLAAARVNLGAGANAALSLGDGSGALALSKAADQTTSFASAGALPAASLTLSRYASEFGGALGRKAASADTAKSSADAVKTEAESRLSSYEGVNMDEELVNLTKYQQAYNASARMITAANQMYDALLALIR